MLKKSFYVIEQLLEDGKWLLFSTLSGVFVKMNQLQYDAWKQDISDVQFQSLLIKNQFLIDDKQDEKETLYEMRKKTISYYNEKGTTTYVIAPTMDCNARCYYCFEHGSQRDKMTLETAELTAQYIIDQQTKHAGKISIHWFGGEPLMAVDRIDTIASLLNEHKIEYESRITTNGYLLTSEIVKKAKEQWHTVMIQVTFDDIGDKYNEIKNYMKPRKDNPFNHVLSNLENALDCGMKIRIRINYDPRDVGKVSKMVDFFHCYFGERIKTIGIHPIDADSVPALADGFPDKNTHPFFEVLEVSEYNESYYRKKEDKSRTMNNITRKFYPQCNIRELYRNDNSVSEILCKYYLQPVPIACVGVTDVTLGIDSHGDIFTCINLLGQGEEFASGNVRTGIVQNDIRKDYQNANIENIVCNKCVLLPVCQGGCRYKHGRYKGNQACIPIRAVAKEAVMRAYKEILMLSDMERANNYTDLSKD